MSLDVYLDTKKCECCGRFDRLFGSNITHNLGIMAKEAGIYDIVWRPDENNITQAKQLIGALKNAIKSMEDDPERYKKYNPENGWGSYDGFLKWLKEYLMACEENPEAEVSVWR